MAAPNLYAITSVVARTTYATATTTYANILTNGSSSGQAYKLNTILASNYTSVPSDVSVAIFRSGNTWTIASNVVVPDSATVIIMTKDTNIYMEESDSLQIRSNTASSVNVTASYEVLGP